VNTVFLEISLDYAVTPLEPEFVAILEPVG